MEDPSWRLALAVVLLCIFCVWENESRGEDPAINARGPESDAAETEPDQRDGNANLTPRLVSLRTHIRACLAYHFNRPENAANRSPWGIMHSFISFGVDTRVISRSRPMTAIGYLCWNGAGRGQRLFYTQQDQLATRVGPGYQGHEGQFLAMLAQSRVQRTYPMRVDGKKFTVEDLIAYEMRTCQADTELTFKLIGLSHYLPGDTQWENDEGETWTVERLIKEELAQPVIGAACGGTHRMMGFSYAVRKRQKRGKEITGQWIRARKYVDDFHDYTFKLQNDDGSFSTAWFKGRGDWGDRDRRLQTTGHILEWLVYSLPASELRDPRVVKAVEYLTALMQDNLEHPWEVGPKGHALHALALYDQRVFGAKPGRGGPGAEESLVHSDE